MRRPDDHSSPLDLVRRLFEAAMDLPVAERESFVRREAGDDPALADEVLALCRAAEVSVSDVLREAARIGPSEEPVPPAPDEPQMGVRSTATDELLRRLDKAPRLDTDRYHLEGQVGRGGVGVVLRLHDRHLHRRLAMKVLRKREVFDSEDRQVSRQLLGRFLEEAQVTSQLDHPGVVPVHELGLDPDGKVYFTMRLVRGQTAGAVFASARAGQDGWTTTRALEVVLKVCDTIAFAHDRGVMHRDLKPANVMVGKFGEVYVMDWGLAKLFGAAARSAAAAATDAEEPLATARRRDAGGEGDGANATLPGQTPGTPEYMAPEQAAGRALDERIDVYAIGAMLYELLTGRPPYGAAPGQARDVGEILRQVRDGSLMRIEQVQPGVPAELVAITERAMARDREERYSRVVDLAADLRAFLDQRAVQAYRTGALVELKLWVRRNKALAASLAAAALLLVAGSLGIAVYAAEAKRNERQAKAQEARADAKVREFDQLAGVVLHDRAVANEELLWPPWPQQVEAMQAWLADTEKLLAMRPEIEATVASLRQRALPWSEAEQQQDRESHPRAAESAALLAKVVSLRHAQAIREGATLNVPALTPEQRALDASLLHALAWERVAPSHEQRKVWGEEPLGLAAARLAVEKSRDSDHEHEMRITLAWALVANGQDEEARVQRDVALDLAPSEQAAAYERHVREVTASTADPKGALRAAESQLAELGSAIAQRRTWRFDLESQRFLHDTLVELRGKFSSLEAKQKADVEQRLRWATQVEAASRAHPRARVTWADARAGVAANPKYAGQTIPLRDEDVVGLVPIGVNPVTELWEFYDLRSAWDGEQLADEIEIPQHREDGAIDVQPSTGIVFVLLPGGTFTMGAQTHDSNGMNYDRAAEVNETPSPVVLIPFFLARHEITRAQWQRLAGEQVTGWVEGWHYDGDQTPIGPTHPADSMDWDSADRWLWRYGMAIPTEAQWEYGCRARTTTVYWSGSDPKDLKGCANVHDQTSIKRKPGWGSPAPITDGFTGIAPVGTFRANAFGLYDVHGNVWEWCQDWYWARPHVSARPNDGLRPGSRSGVRVYRGGSCSTAPSRTRSSFRTAGAPSIRGDYLGLRPARLLP